MKKNLFVFLTTLLLGGSALAQDAAKIDSSYANSHYRMRLDFFRQMPNNKKEIVFLGNSITEAGEWQELVPCRPVVNRGISGDVTWGVLARLDEVLASKPAKIFLLIGVNDLKRGISPETIASNHRRILSQIQRESPKTKVYLQSVLPVNEGMLAPIYKSITNTRIGELNSRLQALAGEHKNVAYVNLHPALADSTGQLERELSTDGLHLKTAAYIKWVAHLKKEKAL